jgi:hypothetical protein
MRFGKIPSILKQFFTPLTTQVQLVPSLPLAIMLVPYLLYTPLAPSAFLLSSAFPFIFRTRLPLPLCPHRPPSPLPMAAAAAARVAAFHNQ